MAYLIVVLVVVSLASFIAVIAGTAVMGETVGDTFSTGLWPAILMLPWFALPAAMLVTIVLLVTSAASRSKEQRPGARPGPRAGR